MWYVQYVCYSDCYSLVHERILWNPKLSFQGPPGGGGPPGTPIMPSPAGKLCACMCVYIFVLPFYPLIVSLFVMSDSTNSGDNMYTMINTVPPGGSRPNVRHFSLCITVSECTELQMVIECVGPVLLL